MKLSYVDVEIGIVNVNTVNSLLKVDVGNSINIDVVVSNNAELGIRQDLLGERLSSLDVGGALADGLDLDIILGDSRNGVVGDLRQTELLEVQAAPGEVGRVRITPLGVSLHIGSEASEAEEDERLHDDRDRNV